MLHARQRLATAVATAASAHRPLSASPAAAQQPTVRRPLSAASQLPAAHAACSPRLVSPRRATHHAAAAGRDEEDLMRVLSSKPRHVARRVRQLMVGSRRKIAQFRNTVTYLMIVLQGKLQKKEISPADASVVVEGIMRECVTLRQADMAHLLFRAALRFRKFGVQISVACVRHVFESYRDGGTEAADLMRQLATEMRGEPEMRALAMAAYVYAGLPLEADSLREEAERQGLKMAAQDYCALIDGHAKFRSWAAVRRLADEATASADAELDVGAVLSTAVTAASANSVLQEALFTVANQNAVALSPLAVAAVCRTRVFAAQSYEEVYEVEAALRRETRLENLGIAATTCIVTKASGFLIKTFAKGDAAMLLKVQQLRDIIETQVENDEADAIEPFYVISLLRGFGVLGRTADMMKAFRTLQAATALVDHKAYSEVVRWLAHDGNVKQVLAVKKEMEDRNEFHTPQVYFNIFKVLGKFYPKLTERYYEEARATMSFNDQMYAQVIRSFLDLNDTKRVRAIHVEMAAQHSKGVKVFNKTSVSLLLRCMQSDRDAFDGLIKVANGAGLLDEGFVQGAIIRGYGQQDRWTELNAFVASLPRKQPLVYIALLHVYGRSQNFDGFEATFEEMKRNGIQFTDTMFTAVVSIASRRHNTEKFRRIVDEMRSLVTVKTCKFYAVAATVHLRLDEMESVTGMWRDMCQSNVPIDMETFNQFLEMYVQRNNFAMMQEVLKVMMDRTPPNPVTTTTVLDMLGKMGRLSEMEVLLDEMAKSDTVQPTLVTYHHAMTAYAKNGDVAKLEALRQRLRREGLQENNVTFNILFDGYGRAKRFEQLADVMNERRTRGIAMDDFGYTVLLNTYAKAQMKEQVENTVNDILHRAAPAGAVAGGQPLSAKLISSIAEAFSFVHDHASVEHYVDLLLRHQDFTITRLETIFLIYHRLRDTSKMDQLLEKHDASEFVYNISISAFCKTQNHERVAQLLGVMEAKGMALHTNTSIILSSLLLKAGKVELAQAVLRWKKQAVPWRSGDGGQPRLDDGDRAAAKQ
jgi:pentatricopeptide repeat protein